VELLCEPQLLAETKHSAKMVIAMMLAGSQKEWLTVGEQAKAPAKKRVRQKEQPKSPEKTSAKGVEKAPGLPTINNLANKAVARLWEQLSKKASPENLPLLERALSLAAAAHAGQKRASGEPYIVHPLQVALLLADLSLPADIIAAGLLHDVIEDTNVPAEEIEAQFGGNVRRLVESVSKVAEGAEAQATNPHGPDWHSLKKLLVTTSSDLRAIVIKLADRLHNMRTIQFLPQGRRESMALETFSVYAPLAHRLGMAVWASELYDRSFEILDPRSYWSARGVLEEVRAKGKRVVPRMIAELKKALPANAHIYWRTKGVYSTHQKLAAGRSIHDLLGIRIVVDDRRQCYIALGEVHRLFRPQPERFRDYIAAPKSNGYQSIHTTVVSEGLAVEVQIRDRRMDAEAQWGVAAHFRYKESLTAETRADASEATGLRNGFGEDVDRHRDLPAEKFWAAIREAILDDEIYIFTPKMDIKLLPAGATAIDFAYAVHTDIGNQAVRAIVNGQPRPLSHRLNIGDVVEIVTDRRRKGPDPDWLQWAVTPRVRRTIRRFLRQKHGNP